MNEIVEGTVVIVSTGQAGTFIGGDPGQSVVLLANGDLWVGHQGQTRIPQDEADLAACPLDVDKFKSRPAAKPRAKQHNFED